MSNRPPIFTIKFDIKPTNWIKLWSWFKRLKKYGEMDILERLQTTQYIDKIHYITNNWWEIINTRVLLISPAVHLECSLPLCPGIVITQSRIQSHPLIRRPTEFSLLDPTQNYRIISNTFQTNNAWTTDKVVTQQTILMVVGVSMYLPPTYIL